MSTVGCVVSTLFVVEGFVCPHPKCDVDSRVASGRVIYVGKLKMIGADKTSHKSAAL